MLGALAVGGLPTHAAWVGHAKARCARCGPTCLGWSALDGQNGRVLVGGGQAAVQRQRLHRPLDARRGSAVATRRATVDARPATSKRDGARLIFRTGAAP